MCFTLSCCLPELMPKTPKYFTDCAQMSALITDVCVFPVGFFSMGIKLAYYYFSWKRVCSCCSTMVRSWTKVCRGSSRIPLHSAGRWAEPQAGLLVASHIAKEWEKTSDCATKTSGQVTKRKELGTWKKTHTDSLLFIQKAQSCFSLFSLLEILSFCAVILRCRWMHFAYQKPILNGIQKPQP